MSEIKAGATASIPVAFDPAGEPNFRGRLLMTVVGYDDAAGPIFVGDVAVVVGD